MKAREEGKRLFYLQYHVDYWDHIGWKDPYSSKAASERQKKLCDAVQCKQMYTPMAVVNGTIVKGAEYGTQVNRGLAATPPVRVKLAVSAKASSLTAEYTISGAGKDDTVTVAVVQRKLTTDCKAGENAGKKLNHTNTVRAFTTVSADKAKGKVELPLPKDFVAADASVIAYVQDPRAVVTGADWTDLADAKPVQAEATSTVLLEFFTSSIFPATAEWEKAIAFETTQAQAAGCALVTAVYHIDEKSPDGFADPLSSPDFTAWMAEASKLAGNKCDVPFALVNGQPAGSPDELRALIEKAAKSKQTFKFEPSLVVSDDFEAAPYSVSYECIKTIKNLRVIARVVEDGVSVTHDAGPMAGQTLSHNSVVRWVGGSQLSKTGKGTMEVVVGKDINKDNACVIVFVLDPQGYKVLSVAKLELL